MGLKSLAVVAAVRPACCQCLHLHPCHIICSCQDSLTGCARGAACLQSTSPATHAVQPLALNLQTGRYLDKTLPLLQPAWTLQRLYVCYVVQGQCVYWQRLGGRADRGYNKLLMTWPPFMTARRPSSLRVLQMVQVLLVPCSCSWTAPRLQQARLLQGKLVSGPLPRIPE